MIIFVRQTLHKVREILNDILGSGNAGQTLKVSPGSSYGLAWVSDDDCVDYGLHDAFPALNSEADWGEFTSAGQHTTSPEFDFGERT